MQYRMETSHKILCDGGLEMFRNVKIEDSVSHNNRLYIGRIHVKESSDWETHVAVLSSIPVEWLLHLSDTRARNSN